MGNYKDIKVHNIGGILSKAFLHNPLTPIIGITLLVLGYFALSFMPREENPQMVVSGGNIIVSLPGASAKEVENVIVKPIERKMKEVLGIEHIRGIAKDDVGIVNVSFYIGEEKEESNLKIYDKMMQNLDVLPIGASEPLIKPIDIDIDIPMYSIAFYTKENKINQAMLYEEVKKIQHRLNSIENVAVTNLKGGSKKQFNIIVDSTKLNRYNLTLPQIKNSLSSLTSNISESTKDTGDLIKVVGIKNVLESVEDIEKVLISTTYGMIYLKDVADISESVDIQNKVKTYINVDNEDYEQVTLTLSKLKGANSVFIAEDLDEELALMKSELNKKGVYFTVTRNDGERANDAVNELIFHLLISVVIIIALLVFVLGWKEAAIVTFTIPAIFAVTLFIAYIGDQTINRITLFAFLLALGLLVDDAIVVVENIHRHFHLPSSKDKSNEEIMVEATDEIGAATNIATFAIILTMVPMAFVGQMMGEFMRPIPLNVPVAMFASLIIAYMFTPYLANKMLKRHK